MGVGGVLVGGRPPVNRYERIVAAKDPRFWNIRRDELSLGGLAEIKRRLDLGEGTTAIARALGTTRTTIKRRTAEIRAALGIEPEPGQLKLKLTEAEIGSALTALRLRLREGATPTAVARELGHPVATLARYVDRVVAEMREAGEICSCGRVRGHGRPCTVSASNPEVVARVGRLIRDGYSSAAAARELNIAEKQVRVIAGPVRDEMAAQGILCRCTKPINHRGNCAERRRFPTAIISPQRAARRLGRHNRERYRDQIVELLRQGRSTKYISREADVAKRSVEIVASQLEAAGELLPDCPCGRARNHPGLCLRPKAVPAFEYPATKLRLGQVERLREHYEQRTPIGMIARDLNVSPRRVSRLVRWWQARELHPLPACDCGHPAFHAGLCAMLPELAVEAHFLRRILASASEGVNAHAIAVELDLPYRLVSAAIEPVRLRLAAEGRVCACGNPLGHKGRCSATWERGGSVRGKKPLSVEYAKAVRSPLLNGDSAGTIARELAIPVNWVWRAYAHMSPEEKALRAQMARQRRRLAREPGHAALVMEQVQAAVSKAIEPAVRDEIVADMYRALAEGSLPVAEMRNAVRRFRNAAFRRWADRRQPNSLDETVGEKGVRRIDLLQDHTALAGLDELTIGGGA